MTDNPIPAWALVYQLASEFLRYFHILTPIESIYLYGSRANGSATPRSDFDFLIVGTGFSEASKRYNELHDLAEQGKLPLDLSRRLRSHITEWKEKHRVGCIDLCFRETAPADDPEDYYQPAVLLYSRRKGVEK